MSDMFDHFTDSNSSELVVNGAGRSNNMTAGSLGQSIDIICCTGQNQDGKVFFFKLKCVMSVCLSNKIGPSFIMQL